MNKNLTELLLIVDRSASMEGLSSEASVGINELIRSQQEEDGKCNLTLVEFDNKYETVYEGDIKNAPNYNLSSRGMTALLDAVGRSIVILGQKLRKADEKDRAGLVIVTVVTDGKENASQEFTSSQIKKMIKLQTDKYNWQFTYLCNDLSSLKEGQSLGFSSSEVYTRGAILGTYQSTSKKFSRMRKSSIEGDDVQSISVENQYTEEEKEAMS